MLKTAVAPRTVRVARRRVDTALVVNPNSCSGLTGKNWDSLHAKMKGIFGSSIKVVFSKGPGDGTIAARNLLRKGFGRVVAIGGDGTINEVANGFFEESAGVNGASLKQINPDAVLGLVPCGTRNVLAKSLELPEGIIPCCQNFVGGLPVKMDVIAVSATDPKDGSRLPPRVFLNAAEMGVGAEIIDRSKKVRSKVKSRLVSTVAAIISTVPAYESNICEFSIDRRKRMQTNMTMGVVANGKFLGGGFVVAPRADISDGLLDIVVIKDSGSLKMLDELVSIKTGDYSNDNILYAQAKRVAIKSKERNVTVTIDGEPIGILPATFQVIPKALNVVM